MNEEIITETQAPDIAALVEFIAKSLVDEPSEVKVAVKADEAGEETTIELSVAKDDMGKVIGKQGRIAKAIRTVVRAASVKSEKKCERADDSELAAIEEQSKKVNRLLRSDGNWPDADQEFHEMIGAASHNEFISRLFPIINSAVHEVMLVSTNQKLLKDIVRRDNAMIVEFIMKRDGDGASHAMSIHIRHMINALKLNS